MKIIRLESVDSTHSYLKALLKTQELEDILCVVTQQQTNGIGSRGNQWQGQKGNLFFSFAIKKEALPKDLPLQSASIYFSFLLKLELEKLGSKLWLKWPNDFYVNDKKIGGTITTATKDLLLCGIGLNCIKVSDEFGFLDIAVDQSELLNNYFKKIKKAPTWQDILKDYMIEFSRSENYSVTINNQKVSLQEATLNSDGSIQIHGEKVFSLR